MRGATRPLVSHWFAAGAALLSVRLLSLGGLSVGTSRYAAIAAGAALLSVGWLSGDGGSQRRRTVKGKASLGATGTGTTACGG